MAPIPQTELARCFGGGAFQDDAPGRKGGGRRTRVTRVAHVKPARPNWSLFDLALEGVQQRGIGLCPVPLRLHQIRRPIVLEGTVDLLSNGPEGGAGIHPPGVEPAFQEPLERVTSLLRAVVHSLERKEFGFKRNEDTFRRSKRRCGLGLLGNSRSRQRGSTEPLNDRT